MIQEIKMDKSKPFVRWRSSSVFRCPECGAPIEDDDEICDMCGVDLDGSETP